MVAEYIFVKEILNVYVCFERSVVSLCNQPGADIVTMFISFTD